MVLRSWIKLGLENTTISPLERIFGSSKTSKARQDPGRKALLNEVAFCCPQSTLGSLKKYLYRVIVLYASTVMSGRECKDTPASIDTVHGQSLAWLAWRLLRGSARASRLITLMGTGRAESQRHEHSPRTPYDELQCTIKA